MVHLLSYVSSYICRTIRVLLNILMKMPILQKQKVSYTTSSLPPFEIRGPWGGKSQKKLLGRKKPPSNMNIWLKAKKKANNSNLVVDSCLTRLQVKAALPFTQVPLESTRALQTGREGGADSIWPQGRLREKYLNLLRVFFRWFLTCCQSFMKIELIV